MPTVVLEAMASGVPVTATPAGNLVSLISNDQTGFLVDRDSKSFQDALRTILNDESVVHAIRSQARELIDREFRRSIRF